MTEIAMKFMYQLLHSYVRIGLVFTAIVIALTTTIAVQAKEVENTSKECADLLLVFARGSSQNQSNRALDKPFGNTLWEEEKESGTFFQTFKTALDRDYPHVKYKAVSVHNFEGKYSDRGYPAAGIFSFPTINNAINAEFSYWPWGDYQDSAHDGRQEVTGFVHDQIADCPDQKIVLGGYSQGAQVAGETLFGLFAHERSEIGGVALFGDPKFVAASGNPWNPFAKLKPYPWKRGTATDRDRGLADGRVPYVPEDLATRTLSWCFRDDFVCGGNTGIRRDMHSAHTRYTTVGIPQAAQEIVQTMSPYLYQVNKNHGGVDTAKAPSLQPPPLAPSTRPTDVMLMVNTSAGMDDVIGQLRYYGSSVPKVIGSFYGNVRWGIADFNENDYSGYMTHRINIRSPLKPLQEEQFNTTLHRHLAWGGRSGGGSEPADPHILATEQAIMRSLWREDALKHLVIITDRPMKESITYNLCNDSFKAHLDQRAPVICAASHPPQQFSSQTYPETCKTIQALLSGDVCAVTTSTPYYINNVTRTTRDALAIARAKGIAVTIVVPHVDINSPYVLKEQMFKQLKSFAESTGGLFLNYDTFNQASYSDMLWQVLNHQPKQLRLASYDASQLEQAWQGNTFAPALQITAKAGVPTVLDASQSTATFPTYKWNLDNNGTWDEETAAPSLEHRFTEPHSGMLTVAGFSGEVQSATVTLPISVMPYDGPADDPVTPPTLPPDLKAVLKLDGTVRVSWQSSDIAAVLIVGDKTSGMPIKSSPLSQKSLVFTPEHPLTDGLVAWATDENASSERIDIPLENEPLPVTISMPPPLEPAEIAAPTEPQHLLQTDDSTDNPKVPLQESAPWSQITAESPQTQAALTPPQTTTVLASYEQPAILSVSPTPSHTASVPANTPTTNQPLILGAHTNTAPAYSRPKLQPSSKATPWPTIIAGAAITVTSSTALVLKLAKSKS